MVPGGRLLAGDGNCVELVIEIAKQRVETRSKLPGWPIPFRIRVVHMGRSSVHIIRVSGSDVDGWQWCNLGEELLMSDIAFKDQHLHPLKAELAS